MATDTGGGGSDDPDPGGNGDTGPMNDPREIDAEEAVAGRQHGNGDTGFRQEDIDPEDFR